MTTTVLLIRHAAHGHLGAVLSGRSPGIPLSDIGREQAASLAASLAGVPLVRLLTSPVQRARETAQAIAVSHRNLAAEVGPGFDEIDFGEWTGRGFAELENDPAWRRWNSERALARPPGGESMAEAQRRAWQALNAAAARHSGETIAIVSHCDIIRALVAQVLALPLDAVHRFDVDPASVSRLVIGDWGAKVLSLNEGAR